MFDEAFYRSLSEGRERMNYLRKCIDEADREKDFKAALELRYLHIKESTFNDDNLDSLIVFPEYMSLFDQHPDLHDKYLFMYAFKWIIESIMNFPQVSIEMAESYFEEFKRRCKMYGYTLKIYYMKQINFFEKIDPERVMKCLELFRAEESDDISDGKADDMSLEICTELDYGSEEKALKLLDELRKRGLRSGEVPQITYGKCVEYFTKKGNFKEAEYYADLLIPMTRGTGTYYMMEMSNVMILKTYTDPKAALSIFRRFIEYFVSGKNVKFRFYFANASYRLFKVLYENGYESVPLNMPREFALYEEGGEYSTEKLSSYFKEQGVTLAEKFDKRNKNTMFSDMLSFDYPKAEIERLDLPVHAAVKRISSQLAVPYKNEETAPSVPNIIAAVKKLPNTVILSQNYDEDNVLSVRIYNEEKDLETEFFFSIKTINNSANLWEMPTNHFFPDHEIQLASEGFELALMIDVFYNKNAEGYEFNLMLKLASMLNYDNSPAFFDMNTFKMLSARWAAFQAETDIPPYEFYMYNVEITTNEEKDKLNVITFGLKQFGYNAVAVFDVDKDDLEMAYKIVTAISRIICSNVPVPDKGEKAFMNAFYNNEVPVFYSWKWADSNHEKDRYMIPEIHFGYDGEGIPVNKISHEDYERIVFRAPNRYYNIDGALSRERFKYAAEAYEEDYYTGFEVAFEVKHPKEINEYVELYVKVEDIGTLTAVIIDGADFDGLRKGDRVKIDPKTVYFWKLEKDGRYYMADNIYLL